MADAPRLFVYGTLRRGERNHGVIADAAAAIEPASASGRLLLVTTRYPGLWPEGEDTIVGELITLAGNPDQRTAQLGELDAFEGPDFSRALHPARPQSGAEELALCYLLVNRVLAASAPVIDHGDWARWLEEIRTDR